jgi:UDP-2,4-diacetamido-2,4,6-trideoxy-beta-L-altropyranose hydrolase
MKNILFRTESSSTIGTGHIMRDLVLADQFDQSNIIFATKNLPGNINNMIDKKGYQRESLQSDDIKELIALIAKHYIDMIVIDYYGITYEYEKELKQNLDILIYVLDDTYEKHYCDILLNHNINADTEKYYNLVPSWCKVKCGDKYTLIRDEFKLFKTKKRPNPNNKKQILIAMGGADPFNYSLKLLKLLKNKKNTHVHLVTTVANPNLKQLQRYCYKNKWVTLHINTDLIAYLMHISDFAIITPSVIANEAYYMGLDFLAIKTSRNQEHLYRFLKSKRFSVLDTFNRQKIKNLLCKL